ncbi:doublesex- and mab-3-related transcription factor A2-like [Mastacembelus armatus]|uniref:doublesex- and mab-3-related transcription factor A2-like n=1 Tax=Mastacembelus armatus TaxID=205130 RepID=UPI000E462A67|nr:doublesex- and mab-3-related transcription factor A2-like [Mastacembelus armatus]
MSPSKHLTAAADGKPRQPKCSRCRHHGIVVPQKGHMKVCPFLKCDCWKCYLVAERTRITALQRNLKKALNKPPNNEQSPCAHYGGASAVTIAACSGSAPTDGGARTPDMTEQCAGAPGSTGTNAWAPLDLRSKPAAEGEHVAPLYSRDVLPFPPGERECNLPPFSAPFFGELWQTAPQPFINAPFRMSGHYTNSYALCPNIMSNMPLLRPVPAGLYSNGMRAPLMFPHFQQGPVHYPPPPELEPPADGRKVLFILQTPPVQEALQQEQSVNSPQSPLGKHDEPDIVELD